MVQALKTKSNKINFPQKVLRDDLREAKENFEKKGWKFERNPESQMWSARKSDLYFGEHAYLAALLGQIEGEETGVHQLGKYSAKDEEILVEEDRKAAYESEGWRFIWDEEKMIWTADFEGNSVTGALTFIFGTIEKLKRIAEKFDPNSSLVKKLTELSLEQLERKEALEKRGWTFDLTPNEYGNITASKHFKYEEKPTRIEGYKPDELARLIKRAEEHQSDMDGFGVGKWTDQGDAKEIAPVEEVSAAPQENLQSPTNHFVGPKALELFQTSQFTSEFAGMNRYEIHDAIQKKKKSKTFTEKDVELYRETGYAVATIKLAEELEKRDVEFLFNNVGTFVIKDGLMEQTVNFHYCANNGFAYSRSSRQYFQFWTDDEKTPMPLSETGFTRRFPDNPLAYEATHLADYVEKVVKGILEEKATGKKAKAALAQIDILNLTYFRTDTKDGQEYRELQRSRRAQSANESGTIVKVPANISRAQMAELWLICGYFQYLEVEEAKKSVDPVEFLRKIGVNTRRGTGGTIEGKRVNCVTRTGGKVAVFIEPDDQFKNDPTFVMTLKNLAKKVVENFIKTDTTISEQNPAPAIGESSGTISIQVHKISSDEIVPEKTIVLVACSSLKLDGSHKAKDLYASPLFERSRKYAERVGDEWFILSAKYGLLDPNAEIDSYNESLNEMNKETRREWAQRVIPKLREKIQSGDRVIILAGQHYRENLMDALAEIGAAVEVPMQGKGIGEQIAFLDAEEKISDEQISAQFDQIVPEKTSLPPIDLDLYEREMIGNGGEVDEETDLSPEQTREQYFADALREVEIIRQTEDLLATDLKPKDRKKNQEQLDRRLSGLSGYLVGTHNYFGKPSAEHLRMMLGENCFYFDDDYRLTATSTEQLQRRTALEEKGWKFAQSPDRHFNGHRFLPDAEQPIRFSSYSSLDEVLTVAESVEQSSILKSALSGKSALEAKYRELIKEVIADEKQFDYILRELEDDYGSNWVRHCSETYSDKEFQEDVRDIWMESDGDPKVLTEKFRPSEPIATEPDEGSLPTTVMQECKFELTDPEIVKRSASMTNAMNELDAEISRFKAEKDKHNANVKMINARIQKHRTAIDTRTEWREIECVLDYDFQRATVDIIRPDTGERIRQRAMNKEEMSKALFKK